MSDIGIDTSGNIRVKDGKIVIVTKREAIKQRVFLALNTLLGEWFLDPLEGTDYRGQILTRPLRKNLADREVRRIVMGVSGVASILDIKVTEIIQTQTARIRVDFTDIYGNKNSIEVASP